MSELTNYERKTLEVLARCGPANAAKVGESLFGDRTDKQKKYPSAQGMALAAGRFLGPLRKRGLAWTTLNGWVITGAGRKALEEGKR